jgi:isopentenyl-diphosphate delta-isomerase
MGTFRYRCEVTRGLIEDELVHFFVGTYQGAVWPHPDEVDATCWVDADRLIHKDVQAPTGLTPWFRLYLESQHDFVRAMSVGAG